MLAYLVNSKSRLLLLKLLWKEQLKEPVSTLAELAGLGFSTAYEELQKMEQAGLAKSQLVGKARVFSAAPKFKHKKLLNELLRVESSHENSLAEPKDVSDADVELNLSELGAPLGVSGKPRKKLSLEQTLANALHLSHRNPTVARSLPVLFYNRRSELNFAHLKFFAERLDEKQALGFFLELTSILGNNPRLKRWATQLRDGRVSKTHDFFSDNAVSMYNGKFARQLAEKNTPKLAKKWHYRMNMELETFKTLFEKFCEVEA